MWAAHRTCEKFTCENCSLHNSIWVRRCLDSKSHKAFIVLAGVLKTPCKFLIAKVPQKSEILHSCPGASRRTTIFGMSGAFMEFSYHALGASSHSRSIFVGFSWDFLDPLKTKLVALSGRFRGLFADFHFGAPPAGGNTPKPTALESTEENISLCQVPPPQSDSRARGQWPFNFHYDLFAGVPFSPSHVLWRTEKVLQRWRCNCSCQEMNSTDLQDRLD